MIQPWRYGYVLLAVLLVLLSGCAAQEVGQQAGEDPADDEVIVTVDEDGDEDVSVVISEDDAATGEDGSDVTITVEEEEEDEPLTEEGVDVDSERNTITETPAATETTAAAPAAGPTEEVNLPLVMNEESEATPTTTPPSETQPVADITSVTVSGEAGEYDFSVGIVSPDTGCDQYADWWEVVSEDGDLIYRRILAHSHVDEQPFVRSGGPVPINPDTVVIVRAHMSNGGYGGLAFRGTPGAGFSEVPLSADFASELQTEPPLPESCAF
jgi:hypothetical protein